MEILSNNMCYMRKHSSETCEMLSSYLRQLPLQVITRVFLAFRIMNFYKEGATHLARCGVPRSSYVGKIWSDKALCGYGITIEWFKNARQKIKLLRIIIQKINKQENVEAYTIRCLPSIQNYELFFIYIRRESHI